MKAGLVFHLAVSAAIGAFALWLLATTGGETVWKTVGGHVVTFSVTALAGCLIALLPGARAAEHKATHLLTAVLVFINSMALTYAPLVVSGFPEWGALNWSGKALALAYCCVALALLPRTLQIETGILRLPRRESLSAVAISLGLFTALGVALSFASQMPDNLVERALFQLTLPSLSEEFLFRGVLLALFAQVALSRLTILGAPVGWGMVATSLMFGLVHGFLFGPRVGFVFDPIPVVATGLLGALFAWITLRCGSVWPAVVAHSLLNATGPLLGLAGVV